MITNIEYLKAKKAVEEYEKQQIIEVDRLNVGDLELSKVLSTRPKCCIRNFNEYYAEYFGYDKIIYISDLVKAIKKDGSIWHGKGKDKGKIYYGFILKMRNMGKISHDEIMKHIAAFL